MNRLASLSKLAVTLMLAVGALALACGQEPAEPAPIATPGSAAPPATVVAVPSTATPVPTTAPTKSAAVPAETPTSTASAPTQPTASDRRPSGGGGGSLVLLRSSSMAVPMGSGSHGGGFNLSPGPQTFAAEGGLTVSAIGSVTVAADEAYVVVVPEMDYGPSGPEQLSEKDRDEIIANLESIGLSEEAVEFEHLGRYEPTSISVEVGIDDFAAKGDPIVEAIEEVVRRSETFGLRFSLSEANCEQAVSLARREAVPAAENAADDLADALGVERGAVNGALEYPLQWDSYRLPGSGLDPCGGDTSGFFSILLPFDSEPEVEVSVGLQVSYDLH